MRDFVVIRVLLAVWLKSECHLRVMRESKSMSGFADVSLGWENSVVVVFVLFDRPVG